MQSVAFDGAGWECVSDALRPLQYDLLVHWRPNPGLVVALAEIEPAIPRIGSGPAVAGPADVLLAERVLLTVIAVLAAVLVPGHAEPLVDTPLTWALLGRELRPQRRTPSNTGSQARRRALGGTD